MQFPLSCLQGIMKLVGIAWLTHGKISLQRYAVNDEINRSLVE